MGVLAAFGGQQPWAIAVYKSESTTGGQYLLSSETLPIGRPVRILWKASIRYAWISERREETISDEFKVVDLDA